MTEKVIFFDLETSGLEDHHEITQFAAAVMIGDTVLDSLEVKIVFDVSKASHEALEIIKYSPEKWSDALTPGMAIQKIKAFLNKHAEMTQHNRKTGKPFKVARCGGYNAVRFDLPRLQAFFDKHGKVWLPLSNQCLDVMQLVMWFYHLNPESRPESIKLGEVCRCLEVELTDAHDALADCIATGKLAHKILNWSSQ